MGSVAKDASDHISEAKTDMGKGGKSKGGKGSTKVGDQGKGGTRNPLWSCGSLSGILTGAWNKTILLSF